MSENTYTYEKTVPSSLDAVWAALKQTSELDVAGGQKVIECVSHSDWTCQIDDNPDHTTHCTAEYDEATHTVTITLDSSVKKADDTTVISAQPDGDGTKISLSSTIRGGALVGAMLKLVGGSSIKRVNERIVDNVAALAAGGEAKALDADDLSAIAKERVEKMKRDHDR